MIFFLNIHSFKLTQFSKNVHEASQLVFELNFEKMYTKLLSSEGTSTV